MSKSEDLKKEFDETAEKIWNSGKTFDNDTTLKLYGYYKQANSGDCDIESPSFYQFKEKAKWDAWAQNKGMKNSHAMKKYIKLVNELLS